MKLELKKELINGDLWYGIYNDGSYLFGEADIDKAYAKFEKTKANKKLYENLPQVLLSYDDEENNIQNDSKPTIGKWQVDATKENIIQIISPWSNEMKAGESSTFGDYRGAHICEMHYNNGVPTKATALANAILIAAAPDLKQALENLVKWESGTVNHVAAYKDAQNILKNLNIE